MKKLLVVLFTLMFAAGAFAAEMTVTGGLKNGGTTYKNYNGMNGASYSFYDSDFDLILNVKADDKTTLTVVSEIFDEEWGTPATATPNSDDHIQFKKVYGTYKVTPELTIVAGQYSDGQWATDLDNTEAFRGAVTAKYALKGVGTLVLKLVKMSEKGEPAGAYAAELTDKDAVKVGATLKFGNVKVMPLIASITSKTSDDEDNVAFTKTYVAVMTTVAGWDIEGEFATAGGDADANTKAVGNAMYVGAAGKVAGMDLKVRFATVASTDKADEAVQIYLGDDFGLGWEYTGDKMYGVTVLDATLGLAAAGGDVSVYAASITSDEDASFAADSTTQIVDATYSKALSEATTLSLTVGTMNNSEADETMQYANWTLYTSF